MTAPLQALEDAMNTPHPARPSATRRAILTALCAAPLAALAQPGAYRTVSWDDLVPPDWDPASSFDDIADLADLPDTDPRVQALYDRMRKVWDEAPTVASLNQSAVRIPGYVVPLEEGPQGVREFLLVPYFGACIHTPPPPANQIIHVFSNPPAAGLRTMDTIWVSGQMVTERGDSDMGASGYRLYADMIDPYDVDG